VGPGGGIVIWLPAYLVLLSLWLLCLLINA